MPIFIENNQTLLLSQIKNLLRQAEKVYFALAFVRQSGVNLLKSDLESLVKRNGSIHLLFANDFGATEVSAIETLQEIGASLKFYSDVVSFHPKAYIFQIDNEIWAIIGSSNLSASGLTKGTEWSILLSPQDMDCSSILEEFNRLWISPNAECINDHILSSLIQQDSYKEIPETLNKQDQYPSRLINTNATNIFDRKKNYIVTHKPDNSHSWNFNIYRGQIDKYARKGEFYIVAKCDYSDPQEKVFAIPYSYLKDYIFPLANCDEKGRYLFEINKRSFRFNWEHGIKMDGNNFLLE